MNKIIPTGVGIGVITFFATIAGIVLILSGEQGTNKSVIVVVPSTPADSVIVMDQVSDDASPQENEELQAEEMDQEGMLVNYEAGYSIEHDPAWIVNNTSPETVYINTPEDQKIANLMITNDNLGRSMNTVMISYYDTVPDFMQEHTAARQLGMDTAEVTVDKYVNGLSFPYILDTPKEVDFAGGKAWMFDSSDGNAFVHATILTVRDDHIYEISFSKDTSSLVDGQKKVMESFQFLYPE